MTRRSNKRLKDKHVKLYSFIVLSAILFLTIGYSSFSATSKIENIMASVKPIADARITGISVANVSGGGLSNAENYNMHNIYGNLTLPNANSTVTYKIDATVFLAPEMGILNITGLDSNLEYVLTDYTLGDKLCDTNNECNYGATKEFYITIKYKDSGYNSSNTSFSYVLNFDFRKFFKIRYSGFTNVNGLPTEMLDGESKLVTFNNTTSIPSAVSVTGASGNYSSPNLTLSNITLSNTNDYIVVTKRYTITYNGFTGNTSSLISSVSSSGGTIEFNSNTGIPSSVTVTGATGNYDSTTHILTLSDITGDITITASSGGGTGTPENPYINTSTTYDPRDVQEGTTIYINVEGEPKVTVDENGNITEFTFTSDTPVTLGDEATGVDTGFVPFTGGKDFELYINAYFPASSNSSAGGILIDIRNRDGSGSNDSLQVAYTVNASLPRLNIRGRNSATSTTTLSQTGTDLQLSNNILDLKITYNASTGTINAVYNGRNYSIVRYLFLDDLSLYLGYSINSSGNVIRRANATIYDFYIKEI